MNLKQEENKMSKILSFEQWYDENEADINFELAETGADRELDFDSEKEFEDRYQKHFNEATKVESLKLNLDKISCDGGIPKYQTLQEIVDQLEKCGYVSENIHSLEMNTAFIALKEKAKNECKMYAVGSGDVFSLTRDIHNDHVEKLNKDE
jgi:hypothetical protein